MTSAVWEQKKDHTRTVTDVATIRTNNYLFVTFMELFLAEKIEP